MDIPGAPISRLDCCDAQEFHIGHQGSISFEKPPAVRQTPTTTAVVGQCRFSEHTIVVEQVKATGVWTVRSSPTIYQRIDRSYATKAASVPMRWFVMNGIGSA